MYSVSSLDKINKNDLKCEKLNTNNNDREIVNKEYKFSDLNNDLKQNLININDYVMYKNNNKNIYIILCNIKFDKEILKNSKFNKLINYNVSDIEKTFINKYSKIYNLIRINE